MRVTINACTIIATTIENVTAILGTPEGQNHRAKKIIKARSYAPSIFNFLGMFTGTSSIANIVLTFCWVGSILGQNPPDAVPHVFQVSFLTSYGYVIPRASCPIGGGSGCPAGRSNLPGEERTRTGGERRCVMFLKDFKLATWQFRKSMRRRLTKPTQPCMRRNQSFAFGKRSHK